MRSERENLRAAGDRKNRGKKGAGCGHGLHRVFNAVANGRASEQAWCECVVVKKWAQEQGEK